MVCTILNLAYPKRYIYYIPLIYGMCHDLKFKEFRQKNDFRLRVIIRKLNRVLNTN